MLLTIRHLGSNEKIDPLAVRIDWTQHDVLATNVDDKDGGS